MWLPPKAAKMMFRKMIFRKTAAGTGTESVQYRRLFHCHKLYQ
jgi:hypothetical protein